MNVAATSESSPQALASWRVTSGSYWWEVRVVGWISQNASTLKTTLYFKWQVGSYNYWPFWNDVHTYTVTLGGQSRSVSFALSQDRSNTYKDKSGAQSIEVAHDSTTGAYSGTIRFQGAKCWETFDYSEGITFPTIAIPEPTPEPPEPEPPIPDPVPVVNDEDPRFYIYADGKVLYSNNDEDYSIISPKLTLELNQTDSLTFILPPTHSMYNELRKLSTTIEVRQGKEILFRGRILDDEADFYNQKSVHCEGALSFLGDTLKVPYAEGSYRKAQDLFKAAIDEHFNQVPESTPYRKLKYVNSNMSTDVSDMGSDEYSYTSEIISSLLSEAGGYLKLEYYDDGTTGLSYLSSYDRTSSQVITFGDNLLDLVQQVDASEIYTSVVCLGKRDENTGQRLTVASANSGSIYVEDADSINTYGRIIRYFTYDDVESAAELKQLADALLQIGIQQTITFTIKAIDLHLISPETEKIRVGDYVRILSIPHGTDSYFQCSMIDLDMQSPDNTVYTFGATMKALTDSTSKK